MDRDRGSVLTIRYLPRSLNRWDVTRVIAEVLHSDEFSRSEPGERLLNFSVKLNPSKAGGVGNDGTGQLIIPSEQVARRFLRWVNDRPIKIEKQKLKFYPSGTPLEWVRQTLARTRYVDPDAEESHERITRSLSDAIRVDAIQFGTFYRPSYPANDKAPLSPRAFSIEWEKDLVTCGLGWLQFAYDHKLLSVEVGNPAFDSHGFKISIPFHSIKVIGVGYDGKPYLCFDTHTPPILEAIQFHLPDYNGRRGPDKVRRRVGCLDEAHAAVSPFAHQLRMVLFPGSSQDMIQMFVDLCKNAELDHQKLIIRCDPPRQIDASRRWFFAVQNRTHRRLYQRSLWVKSLPWAVGFQIELLLHNALLNTEDVLDTLRPHIDSLCSKYPDDNGANVGELLRHYAEILKDKPVRESPFACFQRVLRFWQPLTAKLPPGHFNCCHVTFTPTRLILEGPYAIQSNRVIRQYADYDENFVRVDFRDEDMLNFRWDRAVDGATFVRERVGTILKEGFELAGRQFEFLAYSSSALREHAVWFIHPFHHHEQGWVTSESIRSSLGIFEGELLQQPSKYAARLAQAFTATNPSVSVKRHQWCIVDDICDKYERQFTDGCGTISQSLADKIWEALDQGGKVIKPTVFQIRFLGFKGVVSVDPNIDRRDDGIDMLLRHSMHKFKHALEDIEDSEAEIEIAESFVRPLPAYLNRPLIMLLEDCGVKQDAFLNLQRLAEARAKMIHDSYEKFEELLRSHSLGNPYRLSTLVQRLNSLELAPRSKSASHFDTPFLHHLRQVCMNTVLREIKHEARIPVPESYLLVGIADEGPAYVKAGYKHAYVLPEGRIYACIQKPEDPEPTWLVGSCTISRSPVVHPGDVQRVVAIGKPPRDKLCSFASIKNAIVFSSEGARPLPSCLGGGDLDGDTYSIIQHPPLLAPSHSKPALYDSVEPKRLDRDCKVDDICDFVVEYINSDVLGLVSDRHLIIADQSQLGTRDPDCLKLAKLHSDAVDYAKHGVPVNIDEDGPNPLPKTLIRCKPDWHAAEVVSPRHIDYYESHRALGHLFRSISLEDPDFNEWKNERPIDPHENRLAMKLRPLIQKYVPSYQEPDGSCEETRSLFQKYLDELRYICKTHTTSNEAGTRLLEAETVIGTILAKCSQRRWRKDRVYRMRTHVSVLVKEIQGRMFDQTNMSTLAESLEKGWKAWLYALTHSIDFGANSFGIIGLNIVFDCLEKLGELAEEEQPPSFMPAEEDMDSF